MKAKRIEVKSERKSKKKFIFILLLVFVVFFLVGFYLNKNKEEPLVAESYTIDQDSVDSITTVTQKGILSDIVPVQEDGTNTIEYVYKNEDDSQDTINEYVKYLQDEKGFVELKDEDTESQNSQTQPETSSDTLKENTNASSADTSENTAPEEKPVLKYGMQSQEENKIFEIDIRQGEKYYYVDVYRIEGQLPSDEEEAEGTFTRDDAREYLKEFIDSTHALNSSFDDYTNIFDVGRSIVNNEECYGVSLYQKGPSGYNYIVGKYFISLKTKDIFKYNLQTGDSIKIN